MNRPVLPVATRRVLARVSIAVCFACLIAQATGVRAIHHSLPVTLIGIAFPVTGALGSLYYLHSTRRPS